MKPKTQQRAQHKEASVDSVTEPIRRLVLGPVDPHANDLARPREGNVEPRRKGACSRGSHVVRDPRAQSREACEYSARAYRKEAVSDLECVAGESGCYQKCQIKAKQMISFSLGQRFLAHLAQ